MISKLVIIRHGQSTWNRDNRFTGWTDVDLTEAGIEESRRAARLLVEGGFTFDLACASLLKRAIRTLWIILDEMDLMWIPVIRAWSLNERHYGALQGLDKAETARTYGKEQVYRWRRGYTVRPPALDWSDQRHPRFDRRYAGLRDDELPATESLKDTLNRVLPWWETEIAPLVREGKRILISAHGNSIRALMKHFDTISDEDISGINIPTGYPLIYEFGDGLKALRHYYLGDPDAISAAIEGVKKQHRSPL
ncbi:MAG: 2,3-diphosphoglycerate-dependent phosphoglycerate mutase [Nitrospiraceae bacterium]|nr:MAG: 2,3-diphosphoglycerate-dependent phosphoglycerate mutase [Nitrospiraceae bacterium]